MIRMIEKEEFTIVSLLKACAKNRDLIMGLQLHALMMKRGGGLSSHSHYLCSALINMYAKFGMLERAKEVLEGLPTRDEVSWNALITGYAQHGQFHQSLDCFRKMQHEGIYPNVITFVCLLNACGSIGAINKGREIHDQIIDEGLLGKTIVLGNALVDMYAKCGALEKAQKVFDELPIKSVEIWTSLMAGYNQHGLSEKAIFCFNQMQNEGFYPDAITFICICN